MRGIACGVWFRSSSRTESRMPSREAAQLGVSGLGSHVAAKRAGAERREADFCRRATAERHAKKPTVVRETKGGVGARACVLPEMHKCPRAPCGRKHLPGSGLDVFRVRRWCGVRVQRSHRRTLSTKSDECSSRRDARVASKGSCEWAVNTCFIFLESVVGHTHNSNTSGRTTPTGRARYRRPRSAGLARSAGHAWSPHGHGINMFRALKIASTMCAMCVE